MSRCTVSAVGEPLLIDKHPGVMIIQASHSSQSLPSVLRDISIQKAGEAK